MNNEKCKRKNTGRATASVRATASFLTAAILTLALPLCRTVSGYSLGDKLVGDVVAVTASAADSLSAAAETAENVTVAVNGRTLFRSAPLLINSNTYLPADAFFDFIGCDCGEIVVHDGGYTIEANGRAVFCPSAAFHCPSDCFVSTVGDGDGKIAVRGDKITVSVAVNGNGLAEGDIPDGNILMIPARAAAQLAECEIIWDGDSSTAYFIGGRSSVADGDDVYYPSDLLWLSRIVEAESGGESFIGKLAAANVVLNRIASPDYPGDMYSVIFDRRFGVQFTPTANGRIYNTPSEESVRAAKAALEGYTLSKDALFFIAPASATNFWVTVNRPFLFTVGGHDFYG